LKVFFGVVAKDPAKVTTADVLAFIKAQRAPRRGPAVVRLEDGESGLAVRTIKRRLASVSGLFTYLVVRGDVAANPVPRGLAARRPSTFFVTTIEFRPTLERQRDDAHRKGQIGRQRVFDGVLQRLDQQGA
jgi:integrase